MDEYVIQLMVEELKKFLDLFGILVYQKQIRVSVHLFNQDECDHMVDVANLMVLQRILLMTGIILSLVIGSYLYKKYPKTFFNAVLGAGICGIIALIIAVIIASTGFTEVFVGLHRLIFSNELWLLDPAKDMLINIVPEPYFIHLAMYTGILTAFGCVVLAVWGLVFRRNRVR